MVEIALELWTAALMAVVLAVCVAEGRSSAARRIFHFLVAADVLYLLSCTLRAALRLRLWTPPAPAAFAVILANTAFFYTILALFTYYLTFLLASRTAISALPARIVFVACALDTLACLAFYPMIYTEHDAVAPGMLPILLQLVGFLSPAVSAWLILRHRRIMTAKMALTLLSFVLLPWTAYFFGRRFHITAAFPLAISLSLFLIYNFIHVDQQRVLAQREAELAALRVSNTLSQIKPHFLYNSMTVIRSIYRTDVEKGERAITEFSAYLRHNMDSLEIDRPIPFPLELDHARRYLELQQLRFGEDLEVAYDLKCTDFSIPTMVLQPLVENAVIHGIRKTENGSGRVTIRSREYPDRVEVSVIDTGPGFSVESLAASDGRSHVGIENVRKRLHLVCGGELRIESAKGSGTTATVVLFQDRAGDDSLC